MRQLITRIDEDLHDRLKARAAAEGRSVNSFVTELLSRAVGAGSETSIRGRLARDGLLVVPPQPAQPPTPEDAVALTRGAGRAASDALEHDRSRI